MENYNTFTLLVEGSRSLDVADVEYQTETGGIIGLVVLAVAGTAVPAIYFFGENMEKAHEASVVKGMDGLAMIIDDHKKQAADVASAMAGYPGVAQAIETKDAAAMVRLLGPMAKQFGVDSVTVSDEKGVVVARTRDKKAGDSVANQVIVQKALQGEATAGVEPGTVVRLSVRAGAPVKNAAGKIVGVVMPSFAVTHNDIVDRVKKLYGTDATLFHGDERVSTTIIKDGKRQVGTKLNEQIAAKVLGERQRYVGRTEILGMQYLTAYMPLKGPDGKPIGVIFAGQNITEMLQERNNMMMVIGAAAFVTIALGVLLALLLARGIAGPIGELAEGVSLVAAGDLSRTVAVASRDELGTLAEGFNKMVADLRALVRHVNGLAEGLAASSEELSASAEQAAQTAAAGGDDHGCGGRHVGGVSSVADYGDQGDGGRFGRGGHEAGRAVKGDRPDHRYDFGHRRPDESAALNAAIEVARAGEQGRGFAVVAEEVRKLAEQSEQAAAQIASLIGSIQEDTAQAVAAMAKGTREVGEGAEKVTAAGEAFRNINRLVNDVSGRAYGIAAAVDRPAEGSEQTVQAVGGIEAISRDTMGQTETVSAATEEQSASMEEIASSSRELAKLAAELREAVMRFRV